MKRCARFRNMAVAVLWAVVFVTTAEADQYNRPTLGFQLVAFDGRGAAGTCDECTRTSCISMCKARAKLPNPGPDEEWTCAAKMCQKLHQCTIWADQPQFPIPGSS